MRPRGRTWATVTRFAEVICPLHAFRRAAFSHTAGLRRDIPNRPMREQSTWGIRIINNQDQALCSGRNIRICTADLSPVAEIDGMFAPLENGTGSLSWLLAETTIAACKRKCAGDNALALFPSVEIALQRQ